MTALKEIKESLLHLLFPHICSGCGSDVISRESMICAQCLVAMPQTHFHLFSNNPVETIFWGRLPVEHVTAQYYFTKESIMQQLMHQLKYQGNQELGRQLGRLMGLHLVQSDRFTSIDALIPLPLFAGKQKKRGYNQATLLCEGIAEVMHIDLLDDVICRIQHTETQTKKGRLARWQNMEGKFQLMNPGKIQQQHVLLVDDVITTGATLEACGRELLKVEDVRLSLATLCFASR